MERRPTRCAIASVLASVLLASCGGAKPAGSLASAQAYYARQDYGSARVELMNVLQREPRNAEACLFMGRVQLALNNPASAELQLRQALALDIAPERVYPDLGRAMLRAGKPNQVLAELADKNLADPAAAADLDATIGFAYLARGNPAKAGQAFAHALEANPAEQRALLGNAKVAALDGDPVRAMNIVEALTADSRADVEALYFKAELLYRQGRADAADAVLEQIIRDAPRELPARRTLIERSIAAKAFDSAARQIEEAKTIAPNDPQVLYLEALLEFRAGKPDQARKLAREVRRLTKDSTQSLLLSGAIEYESHAYERAADYLRSAYLLDPRNMAVGRMLVETYLQAGMADAALAALEPLFNTQQADAALFALAGTAYLAKNDVRAAESNFAKASALDVRNTVLRTQLADVRLKLGDNERAIADLESVARSESSDTRADLMLIMVHLRTGAFDRALSAVHRLQQKRPADPYGFHLEGIVELERRDFAAAHRAFLRALERNPTYLASLENLALLDARSRGPAAAQEAYERLLKEHPDSTPVLLSYAKVLQSIGARPEEIEEVFARALKASPKLVDARAALVDFRVRRGDGDGALAAAAEARRAIPEDPASGELLGAMQLRAGQVEAAIATFSQMRDAAPASVRPLLLLAICYSRIKNYAKALEQLNKALALEPARTDLRRDIVTLLLEAGRTDEALAAARAIEQAKPNDPVGFAAEGQVLVAEKDWLEAARAYHESLLRAFDPALVEQLYAALRQVDSAGDALATTWVVANRKDTIAQRYLAERATLRKDYAAAVEHYRQIVAADPSDARTLVRLALVSDQLGDRKALDYAAAAQRLAPDDPAILATLGLLMVQRGDSERGLAQLKRAVRLAPDVPEIHLQLAIGLAKAGRKGAARTEVESIAQMPVSPATAEQLSALRKSL